MRKERGGHEMIMSNRVSLKQLIAWDNNEGLGPVSGKNILAIAKAAADAKCATCSGVGIAGGVPCRCIDDCKRDVLRITVAIDVEKKEWLEKWSNFTLRVVE